MGFLDLLPRIIPARRGGSYSHRMGPDLSMLELKEKMEREPLDNVSRDSGFALIASVPVEDYLLASIPGSLHISRDLAAECEARFDREKEILIYSSNSRSAGEAAMELYEEGFLRVAPVIGNIQSWEDAGYDVVGEGGAFQDIEYDESIEADRPIFESSQRICEGDDC